MQSVDWDYRLKAHFIKTEFNRVPVPLPVAQPRPIRRPGARDDPELIAHMLGVRRDGVTEGALKFNMPG